MTMRTRIASLLFLLAASGAALGQAVPIPNSSFEFGDVEPEGWHPEGYGCEWSKESTEGRSGSISVRGSGTDSSRWRSEPVPFDPNTLYRLDFRARSIDGRGGTPTAGPEFANRDLGAIPGDWRGYHGYFVSPGDIQRAQLRFGQWQVKGTIAFDNVRVRRALPVYASRDQIVLGEGEALSGNRYAFEAPFHHECGNHARPLEDFSAVFNTNRWVLAKDSFVIYRHSLADERNFTEASVEVEVTWHAAGSLRVEVAAGEGGWRAIGSVSGKGRQALPVPADMLPAPEVRVRFQAVPDEGAGAASLQVGRYAFAGTVSGATVDLLGRTRFVAVDRRDPRLEVDVLDLGDGRPGGENAVTLHVRNLTDRAIPVEPAAKVRRDGVLVASRTGRAVLGSGREIVTVPYPLSGSGEHEVRVSLGGKVRWSCEFLLPVSVLYLAGHGAVLPASTPENALWWTASGVKVAAGAPPPDPAGSSVVIRSAKNEAEAVQLAIRPIRELRDFRVEVEPLAGSRGAKLAAERIDILRVHYVPVKRPTDRVGCVGDWPDPLPPLDGPIDLAGGRNHLFWVRVRVPEDAVAGTYRGRLLLTAKDYSAEVPLAVTVFDFRLPDRMTCRTAFGFSAGNVWRYHGVESEADRRAVLARYLENLSAHHVSPYDPAPLDPVRVTWEPAEPGGPMVVPVFDWSRWDGAMAKAVEEYGFNTFRLSIPGLGGGSFQRRLEPKLAGFAESDPNYDLALGNYLRAVEAHLREKGWLDEAFVYWFDEPERRDYEFVMKGFRKLARHSPAIARMLTEQVEHALVGGPQIWCPVTVNYDHARAEERRKAGDRFWWYVCTTPKAPYATLFIDHPATELRVWLWQTWQRGIEGILVWQTNYWTSSAAYPDPDHPQNPWLDPMGWTSGYGTEKGLRRPWGNGDGRFLYPPLAAADGNPGAPVLGGPVDSIRWEMLRDGIEDYEYLAMLRNLLKEKGAKLSPKRRAACEELLTVPPEITSDLSTFTTMPAPIERRRLAIAKAIEELNK